MDDSVNEEQYLLDDEEEQILTSNFENDGSGAHDEEEMEATSVFDESIRYLILGKTFESLEAFYDFYNDYGLSKGFGIRKHRVHKRKETDEIYRRELVCNKQGLKNMKDKRRLTDDVKRRSITRTRCMAMIQVTLKHGLWVVDRFRAEHNHTLDLPSQVIKQRSHNIFHRSNVCKDVVTLLTKAGMKPSEITKIVNAFRGNEDDKLSRVQCSNIVSNERKYNLGKECHGIIMHFQEKAETDQDFYFAMDLSKDGTLQSVFWADGRSRSSYCQFGDVVIFDTTYRTNKFSFPFAPFVGVNHHGQSILFGGVLLQNEIETTFTWLFKNFLQCMHECPPVSIITDQDLAMGNAIAKVFPKSRHRLCAWHIQKHVMEHLQSLRSRYDDFKDTYNKWVKSDTIQHFESEWEELKVKYDIMDDSWLAKMYKLRHHWIKAYLKDTFFAGMTTSGRSESMHFFFDGFVNAKTMLNDFVVQYDKAISSRRSAEADQHFRTTNSKPTLHGDHPIEAMAAECYTRNIYEVFKKEWKASFDSGHEKLSKDSYSIKYRVGYLNGNKENWKIVECNVSSDFSATCSCPKFETYGILCKHILYIMRRKSLTVIPKQYILSRWTMKSAYIVGTIGIGLRGSTDVDYSKEVNLLTLWSLRAKFNRVLEDGRDFSTDIKRVNSFLDGILDEQHKRKKARVKNTTNFSCSVASATQENMSQQIPTVLDPIVPVTTKGRPQVATRIKSGIEVAMETKKQRACGYCKELGHYQSACKQKKMDEAKKRMDEEKKKMDEEKKMDATQKKNDTS